MPLSGLVIEATGGVLFTDTVSTACAVLLATSVTVRLTVRSVGTPELASYTCSGSAWLLSGDPSPKSHSYCSGWLSGSVESLPVNWTDKIVSGRRRVPVIRIGRCNRDRRQVTSRGVADFVQRTGPADEIQATFSRMCCQSDNATGRGIKIFDFQSSIGHGIHHKVSNPLATVVAMEVGVLICSREVGSCVPDTTSRGIAVEKWGLRQCVYSRYSIDRRLDSRRSLR